MDMIQNRKDKDSMVWDNHFCSRKNILSNFLLESFSDPVIDAIFKLGLHPTSVLEIGCANGWRLSAIHDLFHCECLGIDPSPSAINSGMESFSSINLKVGRADHLPFGTYDLVLFGYCLYLCDREDLFRIASEADRVLMDGGYLIVYDFHPDEPYKNICPDSNTFNYKMIYGKMFEWHPFYNLIYRQIFKNPEEQTENLSVYVFHKQIERNSNGKEE
jgi:ubiquinone/menaquinone biosynthesis C-methylase UbiE